MQLVYCPKCDAANAESAVACASCGYSLGGHSTLGTSDTVASQNAAVGLGSYRVRARQFWAKLTKGKLWRKLAVGCAVCVVALPVTTFLNVAAQSVVETATGVGTRSELPGSALTIIKSTAFVGYALIVILASVACVLFVLIPGGVAHDRAHPNRTAIWAVCILFGWTFLGWGIALVWALTVPPLTTNKAAP